MENKFTQLIDEGKTNVGCQTISQKHIKYENWPIHHSFLQNNSVMEIVKMFLIEKNEECITKFNLLYV